MDILFIHSCRTWGGGEVWLTQIVDALVGRGHCVTVACYPGSALHRRVKGSHIDLVPVKISGDFNPFTIGKLYNLIRKRNISLVCVHTQKELRVGGIASLLAGVPVVVSREVDFPIKDTLVNRVFYRDIASAIVVNSFATKNTLLISAPWLRKRMIHVVWKGIDSERFKLCQTANLRKDYHLTRGDVLVGFVGRLDEQKGISTLLAAMSLLVKSNKEVKLVVAGEGNLRAEIEEYRRSEGLEDHIHLAGFRDDIPEFLKAIDFLVLPSNWEGFGYAVVEAMAAGKPVVASHVSSIPEIVEDRRTGLLVPPRSPERLAAAMLALIQDPLLRKRMGEAGERRVAEVFTVSTMVEKIEALLLDTVGGCPPALASKDSRLKSVAA